MLQQNPAVAVGICLVLGAVGSMILLAIGGFLLYLLVQKFRAKKSTSTATVSASVLPSLSSLFGSVAGGSPLLQEMGRVVVQAVQSHAQAAIDNAAAQMVPTLSQHILGFQQSAPQAPSNTSLAHAKFAAAGQLIGEAQGHLAQAAPAKAA